MYRLFNLGVIVAFSSLCVRMSTGWNFFKRNKQLSLLQIGSIEVEANEIITKNEPLILRKEDINMQVAKLTTLKCQT